jgi:Transposase DDE domain group 1
VTECSTEAITFSRLPRRQVVADFNGGRLTSDAGLLLLREVDRQIGLTKAISDCLHDPRDPRYVVHEQQAMLAQRIFAVAAGYEDLNDHQTLRDDPALQTAAGKVPEPEEPLASPSTLCRLEQRVTRRALADMSKLFVELFLKSFEQPPEEIILDVDATDDPIHGQQEGRFYHGYYRHYCFLPLYVFCGGHLLCALLRPANIDPAKHSGAIVKLLVDRIRAEWPEVKIVVRGDSGFCRWKMMRWCENHGVDYVFGIGRNAVLARRIAPLMAEAEAAFDETGEKQRLFGETEYQAKTWDRPRRVIMKAERLLEGPNRRFVITSLDRPPQWVYDECYTLRGDMENRIKEQQLMLFADRTSCHDFLANQFRLLLSSFAYVLLHHLRSEHLQDTELAPAQADRLRLSLVKIAARVCLSARRVVFHLSSNCPSQSLFRTAAASLLLDTG